MFVITLDTDWAPTELIQDCNKILESYKIPSTFFLTNSMDTKIFHKHELAIHPNFIDTENYEMTLKKSINFLPKKKTKGSRSHKLFHSMELMSYYKKFGIEYDSNYYLPNISNPQPVFFQQSNVLEIPFFFGDDTFFEKSKNFDVNEINLVDDGVKVFLFHPFHIFSNTHSKKHYQELKPFYQDFQKLESVQDTKNFGTRTLFIDLLNFIEKNNIETHTMEEINEIWRKKLLKN